MADEDGLGDDRPVVLRIVVRSARDGGIVAGRDSELDTSASRFGRRAWAMQTERFPSATVCTDLGEVLFEQALVREAVLDGIRAGRYVRLVLELEADLSSICWEAALPTGEMIASGAPALAIGLWERFALVRSSATFRSGTTNRVERLLDPEPRAYLLDATTFGRDRLTITLPTEMNPPFDFTLVEPPRAEVFAGDWFATCNVLHFVGHATAQGLELDGNSATWEHTFADNLSGSLRLVFLEACATAGASESNDRIALAWKLAAKVPGVIAMLSEIRSTSADVFTRAFYEEMAIGRPVDFAVAKARRRLFEERADSLLGEHDWMLPILFLSTPGSAALPRSARARRSSRPPVREPLPALTGTGVPTSVRRLEWRRRRIDEVERVDGDAGPASPRIVQAAAGDVAVVLVDGSLRVRVDGRMLEPDDSFSDRASQHGAPHTPVAIRTVHGSLLEVVTTGPDATVSWVRARRGGWGPPHPAPVEEGGLVGGVFLDEGFVGIDDEGEYLLTDGRTDGLQEVEGVLRRILGIDAAVSEGHDIFAAWGEDARGDTVGQVFARPLGTRTRWARVPVDGSLHGVARLGLPRIPTSAYGRRKKSPAPVVMAVDAADGAIRVCGIDLGAMA